MVTFAVSAATRTVRGTNASFAVLPASAAVIITRTWVALFAGAEFFGRSGVTGGGAGFAAAFADRITGAGVFFALVFGFGTA